MTPNQNPPRRRRGCLFWGGIVAGVLLLLALLAGYAGYRYIHHLVNEYTDTKPTQMPPVPLTAEEVTNLQQRVKKFDIAIKEDKPVEPLVLTADDLNALIAHAGRSNATPVRLYFNFNDDHVHAQLSVPTDGFGLKMLKGRYFNGSGDFSVSLHDGRLALHVKSLSVKDKPLPEQFMQSIRSQNFADAWTNDVEYDKALRKLQEVKIENGKLIVIPKMAEGVRPTNGPPATSKSAATNAPSGE